MKNEQEQQLNIRENIKKKEPPKIDLKSDREGSGFQFC